MQLNLYVSLSSLGQETKRKAQRLANNIDIKLVDAITENLRQLKAAETYVFGFLQEAHSKAIQKTMASVEKTIALHLNAYMEGITTLLHAHQFDEAEKGMRSIREVSTFLPDPGSQRVQQYIKGFDAEVKKIFENQIFRKYKEATLKGLLDIIPSTKKIFEQLEKAKELNTQYTGFKEKLEKTIFEKFQSAYQHMEELINPGDDRSKLNLRKIKRELKALETEMQEALRCLPKEYYSLYKQIEYRINQIIEHRKQAEEYNELELKETLERGNPGEMRALLQEQRQYGTAFGMVKRIERNILNRFRADTETVHSALCSEDPEEVFKLPVTTFIRLLAFDHASEGLPDISKEIEGIQKRLADVVQGVLAKLQVALQYPSESTQLDRCFESLAAASKLRKTTLARCDTDMPQRLFSTSFEEALGSAYKEVAQAFEQQQAIFEQGRAKRDMRLLQTSLDTANCWKSFLKKVAAAVREFSDDDQDEAELLRAHKRLLPYKDRIVVLQQELTQQAQEIIHLNLLNEHTLQDEAQRQSFYQDLSDRLEYLQKYGRLDSHFKASQYYQTARDALASKLNEWVALFQDGLQRATTHDQGRSIYPKCKVPENYGILYQETETFKKHLWDNYYTQMPEQRRRSVERYVITRKV